MADVIRWLKIEILCLITIIYGCASPTTRINDTAEQYGLSKLIFKSNKFNHVLFANKVATTHNTLHVYIEGDGTPWVRSNEVSLDPTPRNPIALHLMAMDPTPSIFLGRPCYFEFSKQYPCTPLLWTHQRYSDIVVDSMLEALNEYLENKKYSMISFIGYSGGGVLAMLLAERSPQTAHVVTIAANLDIDAWASLHGYSKLSGSLNPAKRAPLKNSVKQLHFAGGKDKNVPATLIHQAISTQLNSDFKIYEDFNHYCCWIDEWSTIMKQYNF